jgi:hypothetical protein
MIKKFSLAFTISIITFYCKPSETYTSQKSSDYYNLISQIFSGNLAYETTAFVEQYWRVVGNSGFDASIYSIANQLEEAGFINEENSKPNDILTYRIEKRPLEHPTWEPVDAIVKINNESEALLQFSSNRNMIALNSFSTPKEGVTGEVVFVEDLKNIKKEAVKDKIVFAETSPSEIIRSGILEMGALGILSYSNPDYVKPEKNRTSIQFRSIPYNEVQKPWAIALSFEAKERLNEQLKKGKATVNVIVTTNSYPSEELTLVANIKGSKLPEESLIFSAHVQEPGANDNATGAGLSLEMAVLTAQLLKENKMTFDRTLTFLWGDEMISTKRFVEENNVRSKTIKWGISLDMVGENTAITGGSFLIEKMPDPSAIWTRGNDKHTEWGGSKLTLQDMKPHYLNDFLINQFKKQGKLTNWLVNTNPFEGGSDHVPFLNADIPSVLLWHFTDEFYHTDNDRLDKVSKTTLKNVGTAALVSAYKLLNANDTTAKQIIKEIEIAAIERLNEELKQSKITIENGATVDSQIEIIKAWEGWYVKAVETTTDMVSKTELLKEPIEKTQNVIKETSANVVEELKK